jgi:predicted DsbA family dithiol-disulfide isomerase
MSAGSFQLNPTMPKEGISRREAVGEVDGIHFAFDRIERTPNTLDAHRLIWLADKEGVQDAVVEALLLAYFTEGRDINNPQTLVDIVAEAGAGPWQGLGRAGW